MNNYTKSSLAGVLVYLFIQTVACIFVNEPSSSIVAKQSDAFLLCIILGWVMWIPPLIYPGFIISVILIISRLTKHRISSSLISSSINLFGIGLLLAQYKFKLFKKGIEPRHLIVIAVISCFLGFIYARLRAPDKANSAESNKRAVD